MATDEALILVVDDDPNDVFFVKRCLAKEGITNRIEVAADGPAAREYLSGRGVYSDRKMYPMPACVLLDLKLPVMGGLEVLKWIRANPETKALPVVISTGSDMPLESTEATQLGISGLVIKDGNMEKYCKSLAGICMLLKEKQNS